MAPASSEGAGEKGYSHRWSCGRIRRSSGRTERAARCPVSRLGVASGPPPHQPSMRHGLILGHDEDTNVASAEGR
eukprot:6178187-Pleurochrysis_carterae.AAC.1